MTRVIDNLLQNAAKFTAAGSVTVCCDKDDRTRKLRIRVTDTGIGIALGMTPLVCAIGRAACRERVLRDV